mmetsp:Transcript_37521/g.88769  ORF Transcript_37521/g.88769 Transcript_37521/m.88769 type:complete len:254 (-) Transcript_37521:1075-1836(-)
MRRLRQTMSPSNAAWQSCTDACTPGSEMPCPRPNDWIRSDTSSCFERTESLSAVFCWASLIEMSAPFSRRYLTASIWPSDAATCSAVRRCGSASLTDTPRARSFLMRGSSLWYDASSSCITRPAAWRALSCWMCEETPEPTIASNFCEPSSEFSPSDPSVPMDLSSTTSVSFFSSAASSCWSFATSSLVFFLAPLFRDPASDAPCSVLALSKQTREFAATESSSSGKSFRIWRYAERYSRRHVAPVLEDAWAV